MTVCRFCNQQVHPERVELGYDYCKPCSEEHPVLCRPAFVVLGQHKSTPLVLKADDRLVTAQVSYMVR
jgi:hypothetical protein